MSTASRGAAAEHKVKRLLEAEGWAVTRGAGSHGCADLWAARKSPWGAFDEDAPQLRLIQVKTDKAGPYAHFGPKDRAELLALAAQTGGVAELAYWPPRGKLEYIGVDRWPKVC